MKKPKAPKPDPLTTQIAQQNAATSAEQVRLGRESLDFARQQYADQMAEAERLRPMFDSLAQGQIDLTGLTLDMTRQARDDYNTMYRPIEQRLAQDATTAGSEAEQEHQAGLAGVGVQRQLDMQRDIGARQMASMGVRPDSGRFAGANRTEAILGATARAGAETAARAAEKQRGDAMRMGVAQLGRGQQASAFGGAGVASGTASAAASAAGQNLNTQSAIAQQYLGNRGLATDMIGAGANTNLGAGQLLNSQFGNQLRAYEAAQAGQSGLFGALGNVGGMALGAWLSDETKKTDKRPLKKSARRMIDGVRVERWRYKPEAGQDSAEHIGTYAQDWRKSTGTGDGKTINAADAIGVSMAAIKELSRDVRGLRRQVTQLGVRA